MVLCFEVGYSAPSVTLKMRGLPTLGENMRIKPIDVELMRSLLEYAPELGGSCLKWRVDVIGGNGGVCVKAGTKAGFLEGGGYWGVRVQGEAYKAHRLVWALVKGRDPIVAIDHTNGDCKDNRIENLRMTPEGQKQNMQNARNQINNTSGCRGVDWNKRTQKWRARIRSGGVSYFVGYFDTLEEANAAYLEAKAALHTFQPVPRKTNGG